jgi:hypothetical protein
MFLKFKSTKFHRIRTTLLSNIRTFKKQSFIWNRSLVQLISNILPTIERGSVLSDFICSYLTPGYDDQRPGMYAVGTLLATRWSVFLAFFLVWQGFVEYS